MRRAPSAASASAGKKVRQRPRGASAIAASSAASRKKNGPSTGQAATRYSCSGRSVGMRKWFAM
jgi:hypothetical protein